MYGRRMRHGHVLRQEELELFIGECAQLRAEHIMDSDMVCIPTVDECQYEFEDSCGAGVAVKPHSRQIGHGKRRIAVEMVGFNEPLKQVPTHLGRFIGAQQLEGERMDARSSKSVASNGQMGRRQGSGRASYRRRLSATIQGPLPDCVQQCRPRQCGRGQQGGHDMGWLFLPLCCHYQ